MIQVCDVQDCVIDGIPHYLISSAKVTPRRWNYGKHHAQDCLYRSWGKPWMDMVWPPPLTTGWKYKSLTAAVSYVRECDSRILREYRRIHATR